MGWAITEVSIALIAFAAVSGRLRGSALTPAILFGGVGFLLGNEVLDTIGSGLDTGGIRLLAEVTLALVLFSDASSLDSRKLLREALFPARLLGIGLLVFGGAVLNNGVAPKRSTMLASSGFIIGVILWVALNATKVGAVDSYGDYPVAWAIGGATGMTIVALGLIGWGQWLRSEEPVDIDTTAVAA